MNKVLLWVTNVFDLSPIGYERQTNKRKNWMAKI
jgi:hypothetical protein